MKKAKSNPDSNPLRVLLLEDNPADAELIERQLRRAGIKFSPRLVEGKREFVKALAEFRPQVILSDFKLPKFDGIAALEAARLKAPDTPFIFVSGSIGEEKAIETLTLGASDYVFKDNLARLGPAVKRVVAEAQLRLEKKKTDEELHRHVDELRLMAEAADRFVQINNLDEVYDYLAQTISEISGADYLMLSLYDEKLQAVRPKIITGFEPFRETIRRRFRIDPMQMVCYLKDMGKDEFNDFVSRRLLPVRDGFYGLSNRKIPRSLSRLIEKLLGIGTMHTMGFSWENKLFGGLTVFFKKGNDLKNSAQIEAMANLAAVSIKRLLAEQALRESETKYRTLVTQSPDGIFIADLQGNFLSVNQAMCNGLGYSEAELLATKIWDIVPKKYNALNKVRLAAILKGKAKNETMEYMVKTKDGETRYVAILSVPFHQDNKLIGFQGIARDITENKKMEIRLRESEEYYRTLVETSPDAIVIIDAGGRVTFASQKTFEIFGFPAQTTIKGISIMDFVEPGEVPSVQARMVEILSGSSLPQVKEYRLQRHDRRLFWGEVSSAPLRDAAGRSIGLLLICRDISERKRIEAERLALQEIMQGLMTGEPLNDFLKNVHRSIAKVIYAENFFVALYNKNTALFEEAYSVDKFDTTPFQPSSLEKSVSKYIFRSGKPLLLSQAAFDELEASGEMELVGTNAPSWLGVPLKTSRETIGVMVVQDYETENRYSERDLNFLVSISGQVALVVERKRAEAEILREKAFLEALVETAPEGIAIHDNLGRMLRVNSEFVRMFGYNFDEVAGKVIDDLVVPPGYQEEANALTKSVGQGEKVVLETVRKRKDGTLFNVSIIGAPIRIAEQQVAVYAIYRDISERKQSEEKIRTSLKEKEVLLQEIHHRVKNNLQIISGLLTLQSSQAEGKSLDEIFRESQDRIRSIALIHEKLYRSHNLAEIAFDDYLRALTENLFLSYGIAAGRITAKYEMEPIFFTIEKAIPLGLIVNELVTNALKHAFPAERQGEIRIGLHKCKGTEICAPKEDSGAVRLASTFELAVEDSGVGLPAGFEPGAQKSLGMNLVSMLAKQLQAELKFKTGPGTEFLLLFPGLPAKAESKDKDNGD